MNISEAYPELWNSFTGNGNVSYLGYFNADGQLTLAGEEYVTRRLERLDFQAANSTPDFTPYAQGLADDLRNQYNSYLQAGGLSTEAQAGNLDKFGSYTATTSQPSVMSSGTNSPNLSQSISKGTLALVAGALLLLRRK